MGQKAAGLMAAVFYHELTQGIAPGPALARARRAVRVEQDDLIHWSIPALYTRQTAETLSSPLADWILDEAIKPPIVMNVLLGMVLAILIGRLSFVLGNSRLDDWQAWATLPALLVESTLIPIVAAVMTFQGQGVIAEKYELRGRGWLPFLFHKYFSAFVWTIPAWLMIWLAWLGIHWSGWGSLLSPAGWQALWFAALTSLALAAHVGARQAIRQYLLFRRIDFSLFQGSLTNFLLLVFCLFLPPFVPLGGAILLLYLWTTLRGPAVVGVGMPVLAGVLVLLTTLLHLLTTKNEEQ
jgi:hypothetical protein